MELLFSRMAFPTIYRQGQTTMSQLQLNIPNNHISALKLYPVPGSKTLVAIQQGLPVLVFRHHCRSPESNMQAETLESESFISSFLLGKRLLALPSQWISPLSMKKIQKLGTFFNKKNPVKSIVLIFF
ncbi:hypothetical protein E1A91_D11G339900v1 [Gossypium mustelinum]|uniref:Uncharacterized protein n=1 Tax=Gossypium mustelinum TaxID=34275 RepID=A0A5D2SZ38_GOSMU|nr:hypothetical protein E1A91_D11G339900v1 [Gossypium mustelinum]